MRWTEVLDKDRYEARRLHEQTNAQVRNGQTKNEDIRRRMQRRSPPYWSEYERVSDYCRDGSQNEYYADENDNWSRFTGLKLFPGDCTATREFVFRCRRGVVVSCFHIDRSKLNKIDVRPVVSNVRTQYLKMFKTQTHDSKLEAFWTATGTEVMALNKCEPVGFSFPTRWCSRLLLPAVHYLNRPAPRLYAGLQPSSLGCYFPFGWISNVAQLFSCRLMRFRLKLTQHTIS